MSLPVYQYLCGKDMLSLKISPSDVPSLEVRHFLEQVIIERKKITTIPYVVGVYGQTNNTCVS